MAEHSLSDKQLQQQLKNGASEMCLLPLLSKNDNSSYPFEKIFPVYAMDVSSPDSDCIINSLDDDLIWEAVQDEAKYEGYHSLQSYRVAHVLWNTGHKVLALALQSRISEVFGVDIHPAAKIGEGILLDHGTGVVIGETAVVGNRVSLMHGVTLGGTGKENGDRHPKVGDGALLGACVTVLGNIKIGEGAMIASGSLVLKDVAPHSMMAGTPAKVIGYVDEKDPSLTMNHDATKDFFEYVAVSYTDGKFKGY
ncbi:Probable serine acetyltransferase 2 [Linum perenne]